MMCKICDLLRYEVQGSLEQTTWKMQQRGSVNYRLEQSSSVKLLPTYIWSFFSIWKIYSIHMDRIAYFDIAKRPVEIFDYR